MRLVNSSCVSAACDSQAGRDLNHSNKIFSSISSSLADFSFAAWPEAGIASYDEFRRDAKAINDVTPWHAKRDRAFFRGDPNVGASGSPARFDLMKQVKKPGAEAWADVARTSVSESERAFNVPFGRRLISFCNLRSSSVLRTRDRRRTIRVHCRPLQAKVPVAL